FSHLSKWKIFLALNVWVYVLLIPIVHFIFPLVSPLQLLSPILSMLFILFYPLAILLHVSGFGGILDETLHGMLYMQAPAYRLEIALPFLVSYVLASLVAIRYRWLCWVCFGFVVTALFFISNLPSLD
ncbi:MAG: ComEC/Rec2 family competence protein, partial [Sulfurospirillaceae bacterium]|nr:ComEC/Rec2 family competence protein [Sulfurospirillaceae bacterium]